MKTKRILSVVLTVLMVLSMMPAVSYGAEGDAMCETFDGTFTQNSNNAKLLAGGYFDDTDKGNSSTTIPGNAFIIASETNDNKYLSQTTAAKDIDANGIYMKATPNVMTERYQVADFDFSKISGSNSTGARIRLATADGDGDRKFGAGFTLADLAIYNNALYIYQYDSEKKVSELAAYLLYTEYGIANFTNGSWHNVKIIYDKVLYTIDVIIDGVLLATDIPSFRINTGEYNMQNLTFNVNCSKENNTAGIDNVRMYGVTAQQANELTASGLTSLIGNIDLFSSTTLRLPYSGLTGEQVLSYTNTSNSKYKYTTSDTTNVTINNKLAGTFVEAGKTGIPSNVVISSSVLPGSALDKSYAESLTATITRYDDTNTPVEKTVTYDLKAEKTDLPSFMDITGTNASLVTEYLNLPTTFVSGETEYGVSWSSDSELIDVYSGTVLRRNNAEKVNLTATFSKNGVATKTVKYPVTILADGQLHLDEGFDTFADKEGETVEGYNGWGYLLNSNYKAQIGATLAADPVQAANAIKNTVMKLNRISRDGQASISKAIPETLTGKVNVEARVYIDELASGEVFNIGLFASKSVGAKVAVLTFRNDLVSYKAVQTVGGSESIFAINDYSYTEDSWIDLKLALDTNKRTYDVYINGAKINTEPVYFYCKTDEVKEARATADEFNYIDFDLRGAVGDTVYIDDVVVYIPDEDSFKVMDMGMDEDIINSVTLFDKSSEADSAKAFVVTYKGGILDKVKLVNISDFDGNYVNKFSVGLAADTVNSEIKVYALENDTIKPLMKPYTYGEVNEKILTTVFVAGDSTAQTYGNNKYPQTGWGQLLGNYFDSENVVVSNHAMGGRSSRSFISEGRLDKILSDISVGDYLLVQFGHNDNKTTQLDNNGHDRYTDPATSYHDYLSVYVREARKRGAIPVFVTSISRLDKYSEAENGSSLLAYPAEMKKLAAKLNVPVIDMFTKSVNHLNSIEDLEKAKEIYLFLEPNDARYISDPEFAESDYKTEGAADGTHFSRYGAGVWTEMIAEALKTQIGGVFAESYK